MDMLKMDPEKSTAIIQGFGNVGSRRGARARA